MDFQHTDKLCKTVWSINIRTLSCVERAALRATAHASKSRRFTSSLPLTARYTCLFRSRNNTDDNQICPSDSLVSPPYFDRLPILFILEFIKPTKPTKPVKIRRNGILIVFSIYYIFWLHLLWYTWSFLFEPSPHSTQNVIECRHILDILEYLTNF